MDTESMHRELSLGYIVKKLSSKSEQSKQDRILNIVNTYDAYKESDTILDYLKKLGTM